MAIAISPEQISVGKLRGPNPEPTPSYKVEGKTIWIQLDEPDHMNADHTVNDVLRGSVFIKPKQQITLNHLAISFKCRLATGLTEREGIPRVHRWNGVLLSNTIEPINDRNGIVVTKEQQYPFSFTIPITTPRAEIFHEFPPTSGSMFEVVEGRPIPPSFHCTYVLHSQRIMYFIEVHAKCKGTLSRDIKDEMPIQVLSARPTQVPSSKLRSYHRDVVHHSSQFASSTETARRPSNVGGGKMFSSANEPSAHFSVDSAIPSVLHANGPIEFNLALSYKSELSTAAEMPKVFLSNVFIRLTAWTGFRVPSKKIFSTMQILRTLDDKIDLVNVSFNPPILIPTDGTEINLHRLVEGFVVRPDLKPSFRSCAISRWYQIKATIEVSVGGKSSVVEVGRGPCQVLPSLYREEAGDVVGGSAEQEELLPAYEARSEEGLADDGAPPAFSSLDLQDTPFEGGVSTPAPNYTK